MCKAMNKENKNLIDIYLRCIGTFLSAPPSNFFITHFIICLVIDITSFSHTFITFTIFITYYFSFAKLLHTNITSRVVKKKKKKFLTPKSVILSIVIELKPCQIEIVFLQMYYHPHLP